VGSRFSASVQTGPGGHPTSCTIGTGSFPVVKNSRNVTLIPHLLVPRARKSRAISIPPKGRTDCTEPQCLYSTAIPLLPSGPYSLYRTSVPVQYSYTSTPPMGCMDCTEPQCLYSTAIPLLPLWAVRTVQNLSACTIELHLYSPYGLYGL
jgi:hypothetical protein